jgi:DNA-binding transcriptional regulator YdaS (Cro superfamily)
MADMNDPSPDSPMVALDEAIATFDTLTIFADRIGVAQSTVSMWKARGRVPAENCPAIERETGVRCERLRPDVPWDVLRLQTAPATP